MRASQKWQERLECEEVLSVLLSLRKSSMFDFEGTNSAEMAQWLSWLERRPVTAKVVGSSPIWVVKGLFNPCGVLAQLGEHLPYKQRVIGSSPIGPIYRENGFYLCSTPMWLNWQSS